jgi:hypothetical protein
VSPSPPEAVFPRGLTYRLAAFIVAVLVLASLGLFWKIEAGKTVQIHPEGVLVRSGSSARLMPWDSIREVRYRALLSRGGGGLGAILQSLLRRVSRRDGEVDERGVSIHCVLRADGEPPLVLTSGWSQAGAAVEKILERVNPRLLAQALDQVRTLGSTEFGPVLIRHDSIVRGGKIVRFAEVASCGMESGRFFVKKQGAWLATIQVPAAKIPNVFVLLELLHHLGVPGLRRGGLGAATTAG